MTVSAATAAELDTPIAVAVDSEGDLFIADDGNDRVREVSRAATGLISTVAGGVGYGYNGDGIPGHFGGAVFPRRRRRRLSQAICTSPTLKTNVSER